MSLRIQQAISTIVPVIILGVAGILITIASWNDQKAEFTQLVSQDALAMRRQFDSIAQNISRLSDQLSHRNSDFESAVAAVQSSEVIDFFRAYQQGMKIAVMVTDVDNKVVFRNFDVNRYGDRLPDDISRRFPLKITAMDGFNYLAISDAIKTLSGEDVGFVFTGVKVDDEFFGRIKPDAGGSMYIGPGSTILGKYGPRTSDWITARTMSENASKLWLDLSRDPNEVDAGSRRTMILMGLALLITAIGAGIAMLLRTQAAIIRPICTIHRAIIEGKEHFEEASLPKNEIGVLGSALLQQKRSIEEHDRKVKDVTRRLGREASLIQVLSHDLASPLMVINATLTKLKTFVVENSSAQALLRRAISQAQTIEALISHVRDMRALEDGKRSLALHEVAFGMVMQDVGAMFEERLAAKSLILDWLPSQGATGMVVDQISFRVSVVSNIMSNAIKFSDRGGRIEVRCIEICGCTRIDFRDFGMGISDDIREALFSTDKATSRIGSEGEIGTGYGMPLVKFYVGLYGGNIEVQSLTKAKSPNHHGTLISIYLCSTMSSALPKILPAPTSFLSSAVSLGEADGADLTKKYGT